MSRVEEVELTNMCMICDGKGNVLVQTWSDLSPVSQILLRIFRVKFFFRTVIFTFCIYPLLLSGWLHAVHFTTATKYCAKFVQKYQLTWTPLLFSQTKFSIIKINTNCTGEAKSK